MRILVLYTHPPDRTAADRICGEFDLSAAAQGLQEVLPEAIVKGVRGEVDEVIEALRSARPDVVFNAAEAPLGRPDREAHVAALLEWSGVPFTGSGSEALALCRRKDWTNAVLKAAGVPIPSEDGWPRIVKPAGEDGSAGVFDESICHDQVEVDRITARLGVPVVIQSFCPGREFAVSMWGGDRPRFTSIGETVFEDGVELITYDAKWNVEGRAFAATPLHYNSDMKPALRKAIVSVAHGAWQATGIRGYARIDVRLDAVGRPRVLDVNPNPELAPCVGINRAAAEAGWTWERFVRQQIEWAFTYER